MTSAPLARRRPASVADVGTVAFLCARGLARSGDLGADATPGIGGPTLWSQARGWSVSGADGPVRPEAIGVGAAADDLCTEPAEYALRAARARAAGGPTVSLPDFSALWGNTQLCFWSESGVLAWPDTACAPPAVDARETCDPPSEVAVRCAYHRVEEYLPSAEELGKNYVAAGASLTLSDRELFSAAVALLMEHADLVEWALCLVAAWSPEVAGLDLVGKVKALLTPDADGRLPWTVTYVVARDDADDDATAWAFVEGGESSVGTVGLVIPVSNNFWETRVSEWEEGGEAAFCTAVGEASEVLHELVHIVGDEYLEGNTERWLDPLDESGTLHDEHYESGVKVVSDAPCWDECRMVATLFVWGMSQRFPCLADTQGMKNPCRCMADPRYVAYSGNTQDQLRGGC